MQSENSYIAVVEFWMFLFSKIPVLSFILVVCKMY